MKAVSISGEVMPWSAIFTILLAGSGCGRSVSDEAKGHDSSAQNVAVETGRAGTDSPSEIADTPDTLHRSDDTLDAGNTEGMGIDSRSESADKGDDSGSETLDAPDKDSASDTGDVDTSRNNCEARENACYVENATECRADGQGLDRCLADADGCLCWEETIYQEGWVCAPSGDGASCRQPVEDVWKFVVVGDSRAWFLGVNTAVWGHLVDAISLEHTDFVLFPGDLTNNGYYSQLERWINATGRLYDANIDVYAVRGNHENKRLSDWNDAVSGIYKFPPNGPLGEKNLTYSFTHKNAFVVGIDNYSSSRKINQDWLDTELARNTEPHVFVFGHEPAFAAHHQDCLDNNSTARDDFWESIALAGGASLLRRARSFLRPRVGGRRRWGSGQRRAPVYSGDSRRATIRL